MSDDDLRDFERTDFTHEGVTHGVFRSGTGPAVVVIAEIPGITPKVVAFARHVRDAGFTVVLPHLFGRPGRDPDPEAHGRLAATRLAAGVAAKVCVSREFTLLATGRSSRVVAWLRALARSEHERCGGPGVGAIGMCLTGGFALAMAVDDAVLAPVLSQPSLPLAVTPSRAAGIDIAAEDLEVVKDRCARGLTVLGMRFRSDRLVPDDRFAFLRAHLGDAFVSIELEDEDANPDAMMKPHSVVTEHLVDAPGEATYEARDQVIDLFRRRLLRPTA